MTHTLKSLLAVLFSRKTICPAQPAPAEAAASSSAGVSMSVSPGRIGAIMTPVGMPAAASFSIARNRSGDEEARGSSTRCRSAFSVVMLSKTEIAWCSASSRNRSMSRVTRALFVMAVIGFRNSAKTLIHRRVSCRRRSRG